jgi:hypothetical protein
MPNPKTVTSKDWRKVNTASYSDIQNYPIDRNNPNLTQTEKNRLKRWSKAKTTKTDIGGTKTKTTYYKRGKYKGQVKKVKTITDVEGKRVKSKIKYTKTGEVSKEKIKKSKKGVLGILGAKKKAKYTKSSGVTVSQVKGKVDPKKVATKVLRTAALGAGGAGFIQTGKATLGIGAQIFGTKTAAALAATAAGTTAASLVTGSIVGEELISKGGGTMRTDVKGKVTKGRAVQSEWGKMGA